MKFIFSNISKCSKDDGRQCDIFVTGENNWYDYEVWPPKNVTPLKLYLTEDKKLSKSPSEIKKGSDVYISDPAHPVPYRSDIGWNSTREYMLDDQRFASQRTDVLTYQTDILTEDITALGPVLTDLFTRISTSDVDFVVKIIDVFPDNFSEYTSKEVLWVAIKCWCVVNHAWPVPE